MSHLLAAASGATPLCPEKKYTKEKKNIEQSICECRDDVDQLTTRVIASQNCVSVCLRLEKMFLCARGFGSQVVCVCR